MDHDDKQPTNSTPNNEVDDRNKSPLAILNQVHSDLALAIALQEADVAATSANVPFFDEEEEGEGEWSDSESDSEDDDYEEYENEYEFFEGQGVEEQEDEEMDDEEEDEIDPDEMSYEDLVALGEVVGEEKRGLTAEEISAAGCLRKRKFVELAGDVEMCVICQTEYDDKDEEDEVVVEIVGCGHAYHMECVTNWLLIRKCCPICGYEVDPPSPASAAATSAAVCKECGNSGDGNGGNIAGG